MRGLLPVVTTEAGDLQRDGDTLVRFDVHVVLTGFSARVAEVEPAAHDDNNVLRGGDLSAVVSLVQSLYGVTHLTASLDGPRGKE